VANREQLENIASQVEALVNENEASVQKARAYEVKPGLFRVDIETPKGESNRTGVFRLDDEGKVIPAS
jgi:hypothetical protein